MYLYVSIIPFFFCGNILTKAIDRWVSWGLEFHRVKYLWWQSRGVVARTGSWELTPWTIVRKQREHVKWWESLDPHSLVCSDTPLIKWHLLSILKLRYHLMTEYPNAWGYGRHLIQHYAHVINFSPSSQPPCYGLWHLSHVLPILLHLSSQPLYRWLSALVSASFWKIPMDISTQNSWSPYLECKSSSGIAVRVE